MVRLKLKSLSPYLLWGREGLNSIMVRLKLIKNDDKGAQLVMSQFHYGSIEISNGMYSNGKTN